MFLACTISSSEIISTTVILTSWQYFTPVSYTHLAGCNHSAYWFIIKNKRCNKQRFLRRDSVRNIPFRIMQLTPKIMLGQSVLFTQFINYLMGDFRSKNTPLLTKRWKAKLLHTDGTYKSIKYSQYGFWNPLFCVVFVSMLCCCEQMFLIAVICQQIAVNCKRAGVVAYSFLWCQKCQYIYVCKTYYSKLSKTQINPLSKIRMHSFLGL